MVEISSPSSPLSKGVADVEDEDDPSEGEFDVDVAFDPCVWSPRRGR